MIFMRGPGRSTRVILRRCWSYYSDSSHCCRLTLIWINSLAGAYQRETLAARFGDMALPDVLIALAACGRRDDYSRPCAASYVEPPGRHLRPPPIA